MKRLMLIAGAVVLAGCMATTISKNYSVGEVKSTDKLQFSRVANLDDIEVFDKTSIPVVVKTEKKDENVYSPAGVHGLLWLCTLGIVPTWQTDAETYTMNVATPLGEANGTCTVTKRLYLGWVPYMLPFGSTDEDAQCEEELLTRLVSQYKKEWTAENVEKMNVAKNTRIKELRAKADDLLAQKKWSEVIKICREAKNKAFEAEYMAKTKAARLSTIRQTAESAMQKKEYKQVIDLLKGEKDSELVAKRNEAIINLIASSDDGAQFDELMEGYGKTLTIQQLEEIDKKVAADIIKSKIREATDRKIGEQISIIFKQITVECKDEIEKLREERKKIYGNIYKMLYTSSYGTTTVGQLVYHCIRKDVTGNKVLDYFHRGDNTDMIDSYLTTWRINIDRDTARTLAARGESDDAREIVAKVKNEMVQYRAKEVAIQQAKKENVANIKAFIELIGKLRTETIQTEAVKKYDLSSFNFAVRVEELIPLLVPKLAPAAIVEVYEGDACRHINEEVLFGAIPQDKLLDCLVAFASRGHNTRFIVARLKSLDNKTAIIASIVDLLNTNQIPEAAVAGYVKELNDGEATIPLYNVAKGHELRQVVFRKLSDADRKSIHEGNSAKCKQLIDSAKSKSNETFEIDGFYLGMSMDDAELLVMHHFPELNATEKRDDDGDCKLYVSYQDSPFCWANKDRKVYQFNFGKKILKKWYKYDASTIRDWAEAYSREQGIKLKLDFINRSDEVYLPDGTGTFQLESYHVSLHQEIWTYKSGMKNYRLTYFGEREFGGDNSIVKLAAADKYSYISASEGTLRAAIEND